MAQDFSVAVKAQGARRSQLTLTVFNDTVAKQYTPTQENGKFVFKGSVAGVAYAELRCKTVDQPLQFFIENSAVSVEFDMENPQASPVSGSRSNSLLRYHLEMCPTHELGCLTEFVRSNAESPLSPYIVEKYMASTATAEMLDNFLSMMKGKATATIHYRRLKERLERLKVLQGNSRLPSFSYTDAEGRNISIDSVFANNCKYHIILVGASWCEQCRSVETQIFKTYPDVDLVVVNLDQQKQGWDAPFVPLLDIEHIPFLILLDSNFKVMERDFRVWQLKKLLNTEN